MNVRPFTTPDSLHDSPGAPCPRAHRLVSGWRRATTAMPVPAPEPEPAPAPEPERVMQRVTQHEWVVVAGAAVAVGCVIAFVSMLSWINSPASRAWGSLVTVVLFVGCGLGAAVTQRKPR